MRKGFSSVSLLPLFLFVAAGTGLAQWNGDIVAWGRNDYGQCNVPSPNSGFVAVAGGSVHSLGLKADGSIVAWGWNQYGQCDVPHPNSGFVAVAGGYYHSLGLKADGSIVAWGWNNYGQCDVPHPNSGFVAVAGGYWHSLGLKADGSIVAWGWNDYGQCIVPSPNTGFVAVAGGFYHSLGLKEDGSIVAWGRNDYGQCNVPSPNTGFVAVAAGLYHSLGLKEDGSIVAWGWNNYGQCNVPSPNSGFVAVAGRGLHSLGLKEDGSIVAWGAGQPGQTGWPHYGQSNVPSPNSGFVAVAGGYYHSLGLRPIIEVTEPDGSTVWTHFQTDLPVAWSGFPGSTVEVLLYDGVDLVDTLVTGADNTGSWEFEGPVPMAWSPGDEYHVYLVDDLGNYGWSEYLTIEPSEGANVITVTEPASATVWNNDEIDRPVTWSYPALLGLGRLLSGETASILLYRDDVFVETIVSSIPNTGSWVYSDSLPESWESGTDYLLMVVDDLGNYGWSEYFTIEGFVGASPESGAEADILRLFPVAPNPSGGEFIIRYQIPVASLASVGVYDLSGRLVSPAAEGAHASGLHQVLVGGLPSGIYFCRLRAGNSSLTERFVVIR